MDYEKLANGDAVERTMKALAERGYIPLRVATGAEALERIKALIPQGASLMNGSSVTLEQIGFIDVLKERKHGWNNLKDAMLEEKDPARKAAMRKQATVCDWYLGSAHGIAETGEIVIASNTGSQMPPLVFNASNLILVVSTKKIMPTLDGALARLKDHVYPKEDQHMKDQGVADGSFISKILILNREPVHLGGRKFHVIFVDENLGF